MLTPPAFKKHKAWVGISEIFLINSHIQRHDEMKGEKVSHSNGPF